MKKIFLLHCFPVPYRNHLFQALNEEANKRGIHFEVQFYSAFDESRPAWRFLSQDLSYNHKFWKPIYKKGEIMHLNLDMLRYIHKESPDLMILGGVWSSINTMLLSIFSKTPLIAWDETNRYDNHILKIKNTAGETEGELERYYFNVHPHINKPFFKRLLMYNIDYIASPGQESRNFYSDLLNSKSFKTKKFLYFPNLVDEYLFDKNRTDLQLLNSIKNEFNLNDNIKIAYWPARFIPHKGIINFLLNIDKVLLKDWTILLVGHGSMKTDIDNFIKKNNLNKSIKLIDVLPYEKARFLYFVSDLFLLPSLSDSNPLSIVEAIHSSLPLLVSNRVGNINEVLESGINGTSIDPFKLNSIKKGIQLMFSKSKEELSIMGGKSKELAYKNYNTQKVISDFFDDIINKYNII